MFIDILSFMYNYIFLFILGLSLLVFFHELGHYIVAIRNGVQIDVFSVGFGKALYSFKDKKGTKWQLSMIPLGGYVRMHGEGFVGDDLSAYESLSEEDKKNLFVLKTVWQRIAIVIAGPLANYILAFILFFIVFLFKGVPLDIVDAKNLDPKVGYVVEESLAQKSGLLVGDKILQVNGNNITSFYDLRQEIDKSKSVIKFKVSRILDEAGYKEIIGSIDIDISEHNFNEKLVLGIAPEHKKFGVFNTLYYATKTVFVRTGQMVYGLLSLLKGSDDASISGIIQVATISGEVAERGVFVWLTFMATLSISLGFMNLLPIPVLDGGHLLMYAVEIVRGKPLSVRIQEILVGFGSVFIIGLIFITMYLDIISLQG